MKLELFNTVLLAENYARMRDWYIAALDLELRQEWTEDYHYAELVRDGRLVVGIADTKEMGVEPYDPRRNSTLMQLAVDDIEALFARVKEHGGETQGPNYEEKEKFRFGGFTDPEGNTVWVVEVL
ncbi:MAG: VOC family protein [Planctomycetota bacterium]|jgi:predicted enzyme related to lactoylglutathione lyase